jgi:hypothetical protein
VALALVIWIAPALPDPAPLSCAEGGAQIQFCAALPAFPPPDEPAIRVVDQVGPCEDLNGARPSFCLALPSATASDRATVVVQRQDACAQLALGDAPGFCLAAPSEAQYSTGALQREVALVQLRQRLGPTFHRAGNGPVDLWTESGSTDAIIDAVYTTLVDDARAVQTYLGRAFREAPAVFLFTSRQSFAVALERQFGFSTGTAGLLSRQYGGVVIAGIDAVAINGEGMLNGGGKPTIFRHELAHVMIHQLTGTAIPPWIDEGLATLVASDDFDVQRATGLSLLGSDPRALALFNEGQSWLEANTSLGGYGYGVAAEAVQQLLGRVGVTGVTTMLDRIGAGSSSDAAFEDVIGEGLKRFVAELPARAQGGCRSGIGVSGGRTDGLRLWFAYGFAPRTALAVTFDGPGHYAFTATTDGYGVYTGTLGAPMPGGTYVIRVTAPSGTAAQLSAAVGSVTSRSAHGC